MARLSHAARLALSAGVLFLGTSTPLAAQRVSASSARMNRFVDSVLARLTLEEKLGQLTQYRGRFSLTGPQTPEAGAEDIRAGRVGSFLGVRGAAPTREMQQIAVTQSRTRIPLLFADDIIHGWRTIFPVPLAEAASFNPTLAERTARIAAVEGAAAGIHWTFAPMVDITREPRWGRVVEGAGEDPFLGSAIAAAKVRGFQGTSLRDSLSLMATAKHFVAYGAAEGGRDYNTTDVPQRTLHEMYLPPFQAAVNAGVKSIMAAFNQIDGVPMHANRALIDGVLRTRWGWDGILVS
ncbi:glycoside hydrolase family 3 N-terminal domain-containing protein, partial [Gemmatimonas sp.]|uniref:glycoside hydrolase family 3 N-terminal domain-containing protein n=1 Tax=Gemmatimonas sp. TaxID=1962908 RepID=UPI00333FD183